jgi:hypothetical protein
MGGKQKPKGVIVGTVKKTKLLLLDLDDLLKTGDYVAILK